jgi:hypothetical protein
LQYLLTTNNLGRFFKRSEFLLVSYSVRLTHSLKMAEDLNVDRTPGFKVGEKKTIDEYQKLGETLHALSRWPILASDTNNMAVRRLNEFLC